MSQSSWEDAVELPDEPDDETADTLGETAAEGQDTTGESRPHPQVEQKKAIAGPDSDGLLVQETERIPGTESVPNTVGNNADTKVWQSGNSCYRTPLRRI